MNQFNTILATLSIVWMTYMVMGCSTDDGGYLPSHKAIGVLDKLPGEFVFVQGAGQKQWYSGLELINIAKRYLNVNRIPYDQDWQVNIWITSRNTKRLASVVFSSGVGARIVTVNIDHAGMVRGHTDNITTD